MKHLFLFVFSLLVTSLFLTIEWFTIWAWISLSFIITWLYDCFYVSQDNNLKLNQHLYNKMEKIDQHCTRMSTLLNDILESEHPKRRFDSSKFKKKNWEKKNGDE